MSDPDSGGPKTYWSGSETLLIPISITYYRLPAWHKRFEGGHRFLGRGTRQRFQETVRPHVISPCTPDYSVVSCDQSLYSRLRCILMWSVPCTPDSSVVSCDQLLVADYSVFLCDPSLYSRLQCILMFQGRCTPDYSVFLSDQSLYPRLQCVLSWAVPFFWITVYYHVIGPWSPDCGAFLCGRSVYSRLQCVPVWSFPCTPAYSVFSCVQSLYSRLQCSLLMWSALYFRSYNVL